ncbi:MAG TPA: AtpZ/AtpI family protein [Methylophilus sp.]
MADDQREEEFDRKLQQALVREELVEDKSKTEAADLSGLGYGMRLATEFLGGTFVGLGIGYVLDRLFDTSPVLLLIFTFLGFGAGMLNIYRFVMKMDDSIGVNRPAYLTEAEQTGRSDTGENPPKNSP